MSVKNDGLKIIHSLNEQQLRVLRDLLVSKVPFSKQELVDLMGETVRNGQREKKDG